MAYVDTYVLEADITCTKHAFDVVALASMAGSPGLLVSNQFGLARDMEQLAARLSRPFTRLLVGVENPNDPAAVERVRCAIAWPDYPPF